MLSIVIGVWTFAAIRTTWSADQRMPGRIFGDLSFVTLIGINVLIMLVAAWTLVVAAIV